MRRSIKVLSALLAFAVVAVGCDMPTSAVNDAGDKVLSAPATATGTQQGPGATPPGRQDHAKATGEVTWMAGIERSASFDAHEDAPGQPSDRGTFNHQDGNGTFTVEIACVEIDGNEATFGGEVVDGTGQYASRVGQGRVTTVVDGGTPGSEGDKLKGRFEGHPDLDGLDACDFVDGDNRLSNPTPITEGNLMVHN